MGVALEEFEFVCKTIHCAWRYGPQGLWKFAKRRGWRKSFPHIGFIMLVSCLSVELALQAKVEIDSDSLLALAGSEAANANTKAAALLAENIELERALAPRELDAVEFTSAVSNAPRIPIVIAFTNEEEPQKLANKLAFGLKSIKLGNNSTWDVFPASSAVVISDGITVLYATSAADKKEYTNSNLAALSLCEAIRAQGLAVTISALPKEMPVSWATEWPHGAPLNGVVIKIGRNPNHFWVNKLLRKKRIEASSEVAYCTPEEAFEMSEAKQTKFRP